MFGKPKFYNRIAWFLDEGLTLDKAKQALMLEKVEELRARLTAASVHGEKREMSLQRKKRQIRVAIREHRK